MASERAPPSNMASVVCSSDQMRQLIETNQALLKTNESLREMVVSVIDLLKDPTRHVTYPEVSRSPESEVEDPETPEGSPISRSKKARRRSAASPSKPARDETLPFTSQDNNWEDEEYLSSVGHIQRMGFDELDAETYMHRQRYEGKNCIPQPSMEWHAFMATKPVDFSREAWGFLVPLYQIGAVRHSAC